MSLLTDFSLDSLGGVALILLASFAPAPLLGRWIHYLYEHKAPDALERKLAPVLGWHRPQPWRLYCRELMLVNVLGALVLFAMLITQRYLALNPNHIGNMTWDLAFNTAISFVSNTNWQAYNGEDSLSYLSQMLGLGVQNFLSAASGMAVAVAFYRGLTRHDGQMGNVLRDLYRGVVYLLLPLSALMAIVLLATGVVQNFHPTLMATTLEGAQQAIPGGPAASQIAIKQLGTNGGGFFGVNSAYPFENPTLLSNLFESIAILLLPAGFVFAFGRYARDARQSLSLFIVMLVVLLAGLGALLYSEHQSVSALAGLDVSHNAHWEGKESRFGIDLSATWAALTSAASNGSVNAMHDSLSALGGLIPLVNILLGEVIFGGVGTGMYGMLLFVLLTVFLAGLMVGRTPAYLGKTIEVREVQWTLVALLTMPFGVLVLAAITALITDPHTLVTNTGAHGLTEWLYAYASATGNNGSAFAGFAANTPSQNILLGIAMLLGRYIPIIAVLAIAGSLATKAPRAGAEMDLPTHSPLFVVLLLVALVLLGALSFLPVLALGPVADALS
ncbi:potassium-transporting ATPase subunit KdpA [Pokkaliibacter sp. CJK22405]|uniref:potassium-transporting ATPase subunit KdpA n=1 Tax=Pokkaliibacter sp. CJK22405 TaxID=3384615 RepID=UPI00398512A6